MTFTRLIKSLAMNHKNPPADYPMVSKLDPKKSSFNRAPNIFFVGCSGGGGHITALLPLIEDAKKNGAPLSLHEVMFYPYRIEDGLQSHKIAWGVSLLSKGLIAQLTKMTFLPHLPKEEEILEEIQSLIHQQESFPKNSRGVSCRPYVDMLLDVDPAGYLKAAIWNCLQKQDKSEDLKKLIAFQQYSDQENYSSVKNYFINKLENAELYHDGLIPYDKIVSTQAMSLSALVDATIEHNGKFGRDIKIDQYMTDLATKGAIHFFNSLSKLTPIQRKQIVLHGVGLTEYLKQHPELCGFAGVVDIKPQENHMVRAGFLDYAKLSTINMSEPQNLEIFENNHTKTIFIPAKAKVGAVMLGSQGGRDTFHYVKCMLADYDKIFVFGGAKKNIKNEILQYISLLPTNIQANVKEKLVLLENQTDLQIAPIMQRSQCIVVRSGGLTTMELMALVLSLSPELAKSKCVFIHFKESGEVILTSGIDWEDENAEELILYLKNHGIKAYKTSRDRLDEQLKGEALLQREFADTLNDYIVNRLNKEKNRSILSQDTVINLIPLLKSHKCSTKVSAASKLKAALAGQAQTFSVNEIAACEKGVLNKVIVQYEKLIPLPLCFTESRRKYQQNFLIPSLGV